MKDIKIFVTHSVGQNNEQIENPMFVNIRGGSVFNKVKNDTMIGDDTGDNISHLNHSFCEFTPIYWAWKNVNADYYGLCHYRRFFSFLDTDFPGGAFRQGSLDSLSRANQEAIGVLDEKRMRNIIENTDIIVPYEYDTFNDWIKNSNCKNVLEQWLQFNTAYLTKDNFRTILKLIEKHSPEYLSDAKEYMKGRKFRGFNCFIMKKEYFDNFCNFIFPILIDFDKEVDKTNFSITQNRITGYAGEWLFSIWVYHMQKGKKAKITERQLITIEDTKLTEKIKPIQKNKVLPIVYTATERTIKEIAVSIESIIENLPEDTYLDVIILQRSSNLDKWAMHLRNEENKALMSMTYMHKNLSIRFYDPKEDIGILDIHKFGTECEEEKYYLSLLPWILENYHKVIYLNSSLLAKQDISELYNKDMEQAIVAATRDMYFIAMVNGYVNNFKNLYEKKLTGVDLYEYISADIVLFDLQKARQNFSQEEVIDKIYNIKLTNESDIFNFLYGGYKKIISQKWNMVECSFPEYFKLMEYVPEYIVSNKEDIKFINRSIPNGITRLPQLNCVKEYFAYARNTPFYEQIIMESIPGYGIHVFDNPCNRYLLDTRTVEQKKVDLLLPAGSKARRIANAIFPKNSVQWKLLKKWFRKSKNKQ